MLSLRTKSLIAATVIIGAHLALIPLTAIYGLQVCPILHKFGYSFGLNYSAIFIGVTLTVDFTLSSVLWTKVRKNLAKSNRTVSEIKIFPLYTGISHFCGFLAAALFQTFSIGSESMNSLGPYVLALAALLLGVLQIYVLDWLIQEWLRAPGAPQPANDEHEAERFVKSFSREWASGIIWNAAPLVTAASIALFFIFRKLIILQTNPQNLTDLITEFSVVIGLLVGWVVLVKTFAVLKEKTFVLDVQKHLHKLADADIGYRSTTLASYHWGQIFHTLNSTTRVIGERGRLLKGFSSYVTEDVVSQVLSGMGANQGERRQMLILASDVRDFTKHSSQLAPELVVEMLNIYFGSMVEALVKHGLKLDKFIGDGLLAYADASFDPESAALRGLNAARDMAVSLKAVNVKLAARGLPEIKFGVGLHMGPVVIGNIGSPEKMQYTVIGDTVNTAARLEPLSKKYSTEIVLSETVWSLLPDSEKKNIEFINEEELKGLRGPVKVYAAKS